MTKRRPRTTTLRRVFAWLEEHEMAVYGSNIDNNGNRYPSCRDYTVQSAVRIARLLDQGKVRDKEDE